MGQFESGKWIVGLSLYFFALFVCILCIVNAANDAGIDDGDVYFTDPGFMTVGNDPSLYDNSTIGDPAAEYDMNSVRSTLAIMTGLGYSNASIGLPGEWAFIGQFLFFWLPFFMMLWAIYMALPFLH